MTDKVQQGMKRLVEWHGISANKLAVLIDVAPNTINKAQNTRYATLQKIADCLHSGCVPDVTAIMGDCEGVIKGLNERVKKSKYSTRFSVWYRDGSLELGKIIYALDKDAARKKFERKYPELEIVFIK